MWRIFALMAMACIAPLLWPDALAVLRWQRGALCDGQVWRVLSAHFAHLGPWHALANLAGMAVVIELLGAAVRPAEALLLLLASAMVIIAGLAILDPTVGWYAGLSGVVHRATRRRTSHCFPAVCKRCPPATRAPSCAARQ